MKQETGFSKALPILLLLILVGIWELLVRWTNTPLYILPSPSKVLLRFVSDLPTLVQHAKVTLLETILGLVLATALAFVIAIFMDVCPTLRKALYPILIGTQTIPVIVLAPIFIIYLGFGLAPKVLTVVLMCFFPITIPFSDALEEQDPRRENLLRSMGAPRWKLYTLVKIPGSLPAFFSGLKVAATYSISGAVVGEWLSSSSGLGYYMLRVKNGYMLDKVFASVLMVALLSFLMTLVVTLLAQRMIKPPRKKRRKLS